MFAEKPQADTTYVDMPTHTRSQQIKSEGSRSGEKRVERKSKSFHRTSLASSHYRGETSGSKDDA